MKISIITVCYNSEKTIERTLNSILNQTYKNIEYIIVDGESQDSTLDKIKKYISEFNKRGIEVKVISEKDSGIYNAMNKGIKKSTGEVIGILNSDDFYYNTTIEKVMECFKNPNNKIVSGEIEIIDSNERNIKKIKNNKEYRENQRKRMSVNHPTTFVKKELYLKDGLFDENFKIAGDYEWVSRILVKNENLKIDFIDETLTKMDNGGISNSKKHFFILFKENFEIRRKYFGIYNTIIYGIRDIVSFARKILF